MSPAAHMTYRHAFLMTAMIGAAAAGFTFYNVVQGGYKADDLTRRVSKSTKTTVPAGTQPPTIPHKAAALPDTALPPPTRLPPPQTDLQPNRNLSPVPNAVPAGGQLTSTAPQVVIKGCRIVSRKKQMTIPTEGEVYGGAVADDRASAIFQALSDGRRRDGEVKSCGYDLSLYGLGLKGHFVTTQRTSTYSGIYRIAQEYAHNDIDSRIVDHDGRYTVELYQKVKYMCQGIAEVEEEVCN